MGHPLLVHIKSALDSNFYLADLALVGPHRREGLLLVGADVVQEGLLIVVLAVSVEIALLPLLARSRRRRGRSGLVGFSAPRPRLGLGLRHRRGSPRLKNEASKVENQ